MLERFLSRALQARETEARRQAALKVLLALTDLERNVRAGVLSAEDIERKLDGTVGIEEVREALAWLSRGDVRLTTPVEREANPAYELAHERLIPALRRLAGKELSAADRASQLLDQRVNEWLGNQQSRRYLLTWREWRLIQGQSPFLVWGVNKVHKEALLAKSQQYWRLRVGTASLVALLFVFSIAWWYSPWGQIWQVKRDLESLQGRMDSNSSAVVASAWCQAGECEQALQIAEGIRIGEPDAKARALSGVAEAAAKLGDSTKAAALIEQARQMAEGIRWPDGVARALSGVAEAVAKLGAETRNAELIEQALRITEGIYYLNHKASALRKVAETAAKLGDSTKAAELIDEVRQNAEGIHEPMAKAGVLSGVAEAVAKLGDTTKAAALIEEVLRIAEGIGGPYSERAQALRGIVEAAAKLGDTTKAAELIDEVRQNAEGIHEPMAKADVLSGVAEAVAEVGAETRNAVLIDEARQMAEGIDEPRVKVLALSGVAEAAAKLGDTTKAAALIEEVLRIARGIDDSSEDKSIALSRVAEAVAEVGAETRNAVLIEQARQIAEGIWIGEPYAKARALSGVAEAAAKQGNWYQARKMAELATTDDGRARILAAILTVWAENRNSALLKIEPKDE